MQILENFFKKNLKYYFLNKFNYKSIQNILKLKKVTLLVKTTSSNLKIISSYFLIIELLTHKKPKFIKSNFKNLIIKLKIGSPIGCKIILTKKLMFKFLQQVMFGKLLFKKNLRYIYKKNNSIILFSLQNIITFFNFKKYYTFFNNSESYHKKCFFILKFGQVAEVGL